MPERQLRSDHGCAWPSETPSRATSRRASGRVDTTTTAEASASAMRPIDHCETSPSTAHSDSRRTPSPGLEGTQ
eukprot:1779226-Rhodomonas_salina.1